MGHCIDPNAFRPGDGPTLVDAVLHAMAAHVKACGKRGAKPEDLASYEALIRRINAAFAMEG